MRGLFSQLRNFKPQQKASATSVFNLLSHRNSAYWSRVQQTNSLELFHKAAVHVPAYKDFLQRNNVKHKQIRNWLDFQKVPPMSKANYLRLYPFESLCWDGSLNKPLVYTATSGSTGEPFYFARGQQLDWQYSVLIEDFLNRLQITKNAPTLVVVCFGMGLWIGGLITYKAFEMATERNQYGLSLITPGFNKKEILNILRRVSPLYKQTILAGYPPLIKDIVDEAELEKIELKKRNIKVLFAAEAVTEEFRDYLAEKVGSTNVYRDFMSIYGSADIGAMATETTSGILIKRLAMQNESLFNTVFSPIKKTPTLAQFNPLFTCFEAPDSDILVTGDSEIPLIRYAIGDKGGVFTFAEGVQKLKDHQLDFYKETKTVGITDFIEELPFVFVYERADLSTTFYGLLIFPEWVKTALYDPQLSTVLTGKFTMLTNYDKAHNQYLEIHLELKKDRRASKTVATKISKSVVKSLLTHSSEYKEIHKGLGKYARPKIVLWPYEDAKYFKVGIKQKWVQK